VNTTPEECVTQLYVTELCRTFHASEHINSLSLVRIFQNRER